MSTKTTSTASQSTVIRVEARWNKRRLASCLPCRAAIILNNHYIISESPHGMSWGFSIFSDSNIVPVLRAIPLRTFWFLNKLPITPDSALLENVLGPWPAHSHMWDAVTHSKIRMTLHNAALQLIVHPIHAMAPAAPSGGRTVAIWSAGSMD